MSGYLSCAGHGSQAWDGETVCALEAGGCGRLHRVSPGDTRCPVGCADPAGETSLRPVCPKCFDAYGGEGGSTAS